MIYEFQTFGPNTGLKLLGLGQTGLICHLGLIKWVKTLGTKGPGKQG